MNRALYGGRLAIWLTGALVVLMVALVAPASAKGPMPDEGVTIFNEDYTVASAETVAGDLVVVNGNLTMESGSRVKGAVFVWSGDADVEGRIYSDLVVTQGSIYLGSNATVEGNVVCGWNCTLDRSEGSLVEGDVVSGAPIPLPDIGDLKVPEPLPEPSAPTAGPVVRPWLSWVLRVVQALAATIVLALVAGVTAAILPDRTARVGDTARSAPLHSLGIGLLTVVAAGVLIVVLAITICFSPVAVLAALALGAASLFGWVGVGALVGNRLLRSAATNPPHPAWAAVLGTLLISLLTMFVGVAGGRCLGFVASAISVAVGLAGLGAVALSRFGTAVYDPRPDLAEADGEDGGTRVVDGPDEMTDGTAAVQDATGRAEVESD